MALIERLQVPDPTEKNALRLAMRVRACQLMGVNKKLVRSDLEELLAMQDEDGGWPTGWYCGYARNLNDHIGNRG